MHKAFTAEVSTPFGDGTLTITAADRVRVSLPSALVNRVPYSISCEVEERNGKWDDRHLSMSRRDGRRDGASYEAVRKVRNTVSQIVREFVAAHPDTRNIGALTALIWQMEHQQSKLAEAYRTLDEASEQVTTIERELAELERNAPIEVSA